MEPGRNGSRRTELCCVCGRDWRHWGKIVAPHDGEILQLAYPPQSRSGRFLHREKNGHVGAGAQFDAQWIPGMLRIVANEALSQAIGIHAHNRISLGIVGKGPAIQSVADEGFFQIPSARHLVLHEVGEQTAENRRLLKVFARQ